MFSLNFPCYRLCHIKAVSWNNYFFKFVLGVMSFQWVNPLWDREKVAIFGRLLVLAFTKYRTWKCHGTIDLPSHSSLKKCILESACWLDAHTTHSAYKHDRFQVSIAGVPFDLCRSIYAERFTVTIVGKLKEEEEGTDIMQREGWGSGPAATPICLMSTNMKKSQDRNDSPRSG